MYTLYNINFTKLVPIVDLSKEQWSLKDSEFEENFMLSTVYPFFYVC